MRDVNKISMLNKTYRHLMYRLNIYLETEYRNVNLVHLEHDKELNRQIKVKTMKLKNIVPDKDFDIKNFIDARKTNKGDLITLLHLKV
jgi:hypothetical protein